jgi:hypothetical protein
MITEILKFEKLLELFNGSRFEGRTLEVKLDQLA